MLRDIPSVTKNLLILNVLMFIITLYFESNNLDLSYLLGGHYINAPSFKPYQLVSHFFMHGGFMHIFFNMFALVMFGGFLEKLWGPKRFFILYIASAFGAFILYNSIGVYQLMQVRAQLPADFLAQADQIIKYTYDRHEIVDALNNYIHNRPGLLDMDVVKKYFDLTTTPMVGASGAIFGIMAAFAILFPNTELMLLFPPIPIKAKFLIGGYFVYELYRSIYEVEGDNVAHLAHVGGAIVGAILVLFWRRNRTNFY